MEMGGLRGREGREGKPWLEVKKKKKAWLLGHFYPVLSKENLRQYRLKGRRNSFSLWKSDNRT